MFFESLGGVRCWGVMAKEGWRLELLEDFLWTWLEVVSGFGSVVRLVRGYTRCLEVVVSVVF